ncbi:hypothetical protein GM3709_498 [Geminocystis sp. NIES-3709]|nr:hypothetical protein GM3709_498 [Geminocystis sp. NIES-3709]
MLSIVCVTPISVVVFNSSNNPALAQLRGQDSQQFFDRGNQVMEQQIQEIQQENIRQLEEQNTLKEENLESQLEIKNSEESPIKEIPDTVTEMENNVPESPNDEIKIEQQ